MYFRLADHWKQPEYVFGLTIAELEQHVDHASRFARERAAEVAKATGG